MFCTFAAKNQLYLERFLNLLKASDNKE